MKQIQSAFDSFRDLVNEHDVKIETRLEERISFHVENLLIEIFGNIEQCESPIEKLFVIELERVMKESKLNFVGDVFEFNPQYEITLFKGLKREVTYRIDFMVDFAMYNNKTEGFKMHSFAIELDGHDYHERTKKQAARDRKKDRDLMEKGITVIRFTGSEIYHNPYKCARDALKIIENYILNVYRI